MNCEMCGKKIDVYYEVNVEGSILKLCRECSSFGKVIKKSYVTPRVKKKANYIVKDTKKHQEKEEAIEIIIENYGNIIKSAREKMGLKQEELAKRLNEKESLISHIESGKKEPRMELAKKLENFFNIKLIETISEKEVVFKKEYESDKLTIGDMIKIRKR